MPALAARVSRTWVGRALVIVVVGVVVAAALAASTPPPEPASWRVEDNRFAVIGEGGEVLWEKEFVDPLRIEEYRLPGPTSQSVVIADIIGDGTSEVLFIERPVQIPRRHRLYCYDAEGQILLDYVPDLDVSFGSRPFEPPWNASIVSVTRDEAGTPYVWLVSTHKWSPSVVQKLSADGEVLASFWNFGHIRAINDGYLNGRHVVVLGGINDEHHGAFVAVLDHDQPVGRAPSQMPESDCVSCVQRDPLAYVVLPSHGLWDYLDTKPEVDQVTVQPHSGIVEVVVSGGIPGWEGSTPTYATHYVFDSHMTLLSASFDTDYLRALQVARKAGYSIPKEYEPRQEDLLPVLAWNGKSFVPQR